MLEKKVENPDYTKFEYVLNGKEGIEEIQKRKYTILIEGKKDCGGIYIIRNIANEKFYIGSSVGIRRRWRLHLIGLLKEKHDNSKLQFSWNKHIPDDYLFYVIEYIDKRNFDNEKNFKKELRKREQYYLNLYSPFKERGYNIKRKSTGGMNSATFEDLKQGKLIINEEEFSKIMYMMCETDATLGEIAKEIGCCINTVCSINNGTTWRTDELNYPLRQKTIYKRPKLTTTKKKEKEKRRGVDRRLSEPPVAKEQLVADCFISYSYAARKYGCSMKSVRRYLEYYDIPYKSQDFRNWYKEKYNIPQKIVKKKFNYKEHLKNEKVDI